MRILVETAELRGDETVLEVGAATGSLTEELLERAGTVVAVEVDAKLAEILTERLGGREELTIITGDVLAGKHEISPAVLETLGLRASLVSNLPYNIATPLIAECLVVSWRAARGETGFCRFESLTFTVQKEVAERLSASPGGGDYGPVSVLAELLGKVTVGREVPASAFWPRPAVQSQIMRIDFDGGCVERIVDVDILRELLRVSFGQRRKQLGGVFRRAGGGIDAEVLRQVGVVPQSRAEQVSPEQFAAMANYIAEHRPS
jgi:16S rRNA (adenine1518-N6/adenine1519-N6)-dimethyltransferase